MCKSDTEHGKNCQDEICVQQFESGDFVEGEFTELLKSAIGMAHNTSVFGAVAPMVEYILRIGGQRTKSLWSNITFGVFCRAVKCILSLSVSPEKVEEKAALAFDLKTLIMGIMHENLSQFEETYPSLDKRAAHALKFLRDEGNFENIVKEWTKVGGLRVHHNKTAHPFDFDMFLVQQGQAVQFLQDSLDDDFSSQFQHIGALGLFLVKQNVKSCVHHDNDTMEDLAHNFSYAL
ncbi:unnamed protein product [Calypogeia fissa]